MKYKLTYSQAKGLILTFRADYSGPMALYRRLYKHIQSFGGCQYGIDWRTLNITHPQLSAYMQTIHKLYNRDWERLGVWTDRILGHTKNYSGRKLTP